MQTTANVYNHSTYKFSFKSFTLTLMKKQQEKYHLIEDLLKPYMLNCMRKGSNLT